MGDGENWDDRFDYAKAKRTETTRFYVKTHLRAKFVKKQKKIVGKNGKKFRMSTCPFLHYHLQPRANSVKQTIGSFVGSLDLGLKDQVKGLLVCCSRCPGIGSIVHSDSAMLCVSARFICTVGQSDNGCQSEVYVY